MKRTGLTLRSLSRPPFPPMGVSVGMAVNAKGVTDIKGTNVTTPFPASIGQGTNSKAGYLNLYGNASCGTTIGKFFVVHARGTGGE